MAEEPETQPASDFTPRKVRLDGGLKKQTKLRDEIAKAMSDEMLVCSLDGFLEQLAPFSPDVRWVDTAYDRLRVKNLMRTPAKTTQRNTRRFTRGRTHRKSRAADAEHQVDVETADAAQWASYCNGTPAQIRKNEMNTFKPLEKIVEALRDCPDPDPDSTRVSNGYRYKDCPYQEMSSEIMGANFKVDAVIANPNIYIESKEPIALAAAQTAVAMEFKKEASTDKVYENRKQLVAAANHIMNDDPRRSWMYGITIENTNMSLWYFSRSYSMKSAPFDFTKDLKAFIRVFLSFLYANEEELGHDPSIYRKYYNEKWCYIYEVQTEEGFKYYRTVESLYNPRSYCITGRKSRVWKVVEVAGLDDSAPISGHEVALKDCWVDQGSLSESEIQTQIFKRLKDVEEADYAWAPSGLKERLKTGLTRPETYFMQVVWDWRQGLNKEKPPSHPDCNLLSDPVERSFADRRKVILSTQTLPPTAYPSLHASNTSVSTAASSHLPYTLRHYKVKQHYRVVYAEVGESLAYATSLSDAVGAFEDIFIALTLLFLARWVHRDVSEGNIILVRSEHGVRAKLSDLEYARFFAEDRTIGTDPKTGTPYFMPLEIHKGLFLFRKSLSNELDLSSMAMNKNRIRRPKSASPSLRYNFAHDLESLWWIMVWIIVVRIKGAPWLYELIFTALDSPHPHREAFFKKGDFLHNHLARLIHKTLHDRSAHVSLVVYNLSLCEFYANGKRQEATSYQTIYSTVWTAMELFVRNMSSVSMELEDPHLRAPPPPVSLPIVQELGKRSRSANNDSVPDRKTTAEDGSSRKKPKSGGDVLKDTDAENTAEEDTVEGIGEDRNRFQG